MVCKSTDTGNPSETCVFIPQVQEDRRSSRNLSLLVLSEGISVEPEKVTFDLKPEKTDGDPESDTGESDGGQKKAGKSCCSTYAGILLTLASGVVFTIGGIIVKYMKDYHPFTLAVFRFQGAFIPSVFWVAYCVYVKKLPIFEPIWPITTREKGKKFLGLVLRCVIGTTALFMFFYALQRIDVADALVIGSCQSVFVTVAAYFLLGEACGVIPVFAAFLSIVGVGIISRPPILTGAESFDEETLIGTGLAFGAVLTASIVFVIIRYLKDVHVSLLTLGFGLWGTIQSIIGSVIIGEFKVPHDAHHWALAVGLATVTLLGQVMLTMALQCEQAGPVALVRTSDCITGFVLQYLLLSTVPDLFSLIGASIIICCVILTALRKWISTLPKTHSARQRLWFLLV